VLVDCLTDNKNRTVADLKYIFDRHGGNIGSPGCVSWIFEKKGVINFDKGKIEEDKLLEVALDAGAEDVSQSGDQFEVVMKPNDFEKVKKLLILWASSTASLKSR
jgi:transcriptional/translational regulatory protein YebC/TACO1